MAPVLPIRLDGTSARYKASDLHEGMRCQLPGIRIEPKVNNTLRGHARYRGAAGLQLFGSITGDIPLNLIFGAFGLRAFGLGFLALVLLYRIEMKQSSAHDIHAGSKVL
jgi:hypothetical protein